MDNTDDQGGPTGDLVGRPRWMWVAMAVIFAIVLAGAGYLVYDATQSDDDAASTIPIDNGGAVELPQNPSLKLLLEDGNWFVENDGNVTMSQVEVRDNATDVLCAIGTVSPGDRAPCEEAASDEDLTATGVGPQGQQVEVSSG